MGWTIARTLYRWKRSKGLQTGLVLLISAMGSSSCKAPEKGLNHYLTRHESVSLLCVLTMGRLYRLVVGGKGKIDRGFVSALSR
jgi:hypothetical protein